MNDRKLHIVAAKREPAFVLTCPECAKGTNFFFDAACREWEIKRRCTCKIQCETDSAHIIGNATYIHFCIYRETYSGRMDNRTEGV